MDLAQLAQVGEFLGGVAVLVTLVYLAVQVRVGNLSERATTHRALVDQWNRSFAEPLRDPQLAPLLRRAFADFDALDEDEKTIAGMFFAGAMNVGQQADALRDSPAIDPETARVFEGAVAAILQVPGPARWWERAGLGWSPSFQERMREVIASEDRPPPITSWFPWLMGDPSAR